MTTTQSETTAVPETYECAHVAKVECLTCGHATTDRLDIDLWNGYGDCPQTASHPNPGGGEPTRWTMFDGRVTVIDADGHRETTAPVHLFQPIVTLAVREDGRYDVTIDWADSYLGGMLPSDPMPTEDARGAVMACDAVDRWSKQQPSTLIIAASTPDALGALPIEP